MRRWQIYTLSITGLLVFATLFVAGITWLAYAYIPRVNMHSIDEFRSSRDRMMAKMTDDEKARLLFLINYHDSWIVKDIETYRTLGGSGPCHGMMVKEFVDFLEDDWDSDRKSAVKLHVQIECSNISQKANTKISGEDDERIGRIIAGGDAVQAEKDFMEKIKKTREEAIGSAVLVASAGIDPDFNLGPKPVWKWRKESDSESEIAELKAMASEIVKVTGSVFEEQSLDRLRKLGVN